MGDIHGAYRALRQCLERSGFDYGNDRLICLGDVCDGWPETRACVDELLKIANLTFLMGNHDWWTLEWMTTGAVESVWFMQGGEATVRSYDDQVPQAHIDFFKDALPYHTEGNKLFVHAGFDPRRELYEQGTDIFLWDRNLARTALDYFIREIETKFTSYDEVYLGHTPVPFQHPVRSGDVWLMDTGAGWSGVLSMMDLSTKEIITSDAVPSLYPGIKGRTWSRG
jgi:serine/threonine protein phosphatase 1